MVAGVSRFSEGVSWSGVDVTLSMFVVFPSSHVVSLAPPPGAQTPDHVKVYPLMDDGNLLAGREVVEYDVVFLDMPRDPESVVSAWLEASLEAGAEFSWFAYEGTFRYTEILTEYVAPRMYAVAAAGIVAIAVDDDVRDSAQWVDQITPLRRRLLSL